MANFREKFKWSNTDVLGSGAFATVFRGEIIANGRPCAIKVTNLAIIGRHAATVRHQATREIELMRSISDHPFVLTYYGDFIGDTNAYVSIELAPRGSMQSYVDSPTWHQGAEMSFLGPRLAAELLIALEHLHSHGYVHRDIKPDNALLSRSLHVKLSDFGTAARLTEPSELCSFAGTWEYAAPELLVPRGEASIASDVWAYVCTIYALFAGAPPFGNAATVGDFELRRRIGAAIEAAAVDRGNVCPLDPDDTAPAPLAASLSRSASGATTGTSLPVGSAVANWQTSIGWCAQHGLASLGVRMDAVPHAVVRLLLAAFVPAAERPTLAGLTSDPFFEGLGVEWSEIVAARAHAGAGSVHGACPPSPSPSPSPSVDGALRSATTRLLQLSNETALNQQHVEQAGRHLLPGESIGISGYVVKVRYLSRRTRLLVLTSHGRLLWLEADGTHALMGQLQLPVCDPCTPPPPIPRSPSASPSPRSPDVPGVSMAGNIAYDPTPLSPTGHPEAIPFRRATPHPSEARAGVKLPLTLPLPIHIPLLSPKADTSARAASLAVTPEAKRTFAAAAKAAAVYADVTDAYSFRVVTKRRAFAFNTLDPTAALWRDRINAFCAPWLVATPTLPRWRSQRSAISDGRSFGGSFPGPQSPGAPRAAPRPQSAGVPAGASVRDAASLGAPLRPPQPPPAAPTAPAVPAAAPTQAPSSGAATFGETFASQPASPTSNGDDSSAVLPDGVALVDDDLRTPPAQGGHPRTASYRSRPLALDPTLVIGDSGSATPQVDVAEIAAEVSEPSDASVVRELATGGAHSPGQEKPTIDGSVCVGSPIPPTPVGQFGQFDEPAV